MSIDIVVNKIMCKSRNSGFHKNITIGKWYTNTSKIDNKFYIIDDNGEGGVFDCNLFLTQSELRDLRISRLLK